LYHGVKIGAVETAGNVFLAPVAGWSDAAFRSLCVREGAAFTFTELVSAEALARGSMKNDYLLRPSIPAAPPAPPPAASPYAIQLFGAKADVLAAAAEKCLAYRPAAIDLNAGCPVPKVVKTGAGAALMKAPAAIRRIVEVLRRVCDAAPGGAAVTVKMRSGFDESSVNFLDCAKAAEDGGAAFITLHPRTRAQGYGGQSNWEHIARLKAAVNTPVAGSGDLYSPEDAARMLRETGCDCVMFARGAMGNPFIFRQTISFLQTGRFSEVVEEEKITAALEQLEILSSYMGERAACLEMRKVFCAYTKNIHGGTKLRSLLVHASSTADYRKILSAANGGKPLP
jgi:nifR3 family TIM-barrel protein